MQHIDMYTSVEVNKDCTNIISNYCFLNSMLVYSVDYNCILQKASKIEKWVPVQAAAKRQRNTLDMVERAGP